MADTSPPRNLESRISSPNNGYADSHSEAVSRRYRLAPWMVGFVFVLLTLGNQPIIPPLNHLLELNNCRDYYALHDPSVIGPDGQLAENLCKGDLIQTRLAELLGLITTLGMPVVRPPFVSPMHALIS